MRRLACLLSTDEWSKVGVMRRFLDQHPIAVWRCGLTVGPQRRSLIWPMPLYFFHESKTRYRAICVDLTAENRLGLDAIPEEFHKDLTPYTAFFHFTTIEPIPEMHIRAFEKWNAPNKHYQRGQLGLLYVVDPLPLR